MMEMALTMGEVDQAGAFLACDPSYVKSVQIGMKPERPFKST